MKNKSRKIQIILLSALFLSLSAGISFIAARTASQRLSSVSNHDVKIGFISFSFISRELTINKLSIDDKIFADRISVRISPVRFFKTVENPLQYISKIKASNLKVVIDEDYYLSDNQVIDGNQIKEILFPDFDLDVSIDKISIIKGLDNWTVSSIKGLFSKERAVVLSVLSRGQINIRTEIDIAPDIDNFIKTHIDALSDDKLKFFINIDGSLDLNSFNFNQTFLIENISYGDFGIEAIYGDAIRDLKGFRLNIKEYFGNINIVSNNMSDFISNGQIDISKINKNINALTKFDLLFNLDGVFELNLKTSDLSLYGFEFGVFDIKVIRSENGVYDMAYKYGLNNELSAQYLPDGEVDFKILVNKAPVGFGWINTKTGQADINIKSIAVKDIPLTPFVKDNPSGRASFSGVIGTNAGIINFNVKGFQTSKITKMDIVGFYENEGDKRILNFYSADGFISFNAVTLEGNVLESLNFKFIKGRINKMLMAAGISSIDIKGMASGKIVYEKDKNLALDMDISDGEFYGNKFNAFILKGELTNDLLRISNFSLIDSKGVFIVKADGDFGFSNNVPASLLNIEINRFLVKGIPISAKLELRGESDRSGTNNGMLNGEYIDIGQLAFQKVSAKTSVSRKKVIISGLSAKNGLKADFEYISDGGQISADISLNNSDFSSIYKGLQAKVNMDMDISGTLKDPEISADITVKNAQIMNIPFSLKSKYSQKRNDIYIKNTEILIGDKGKISFDGKYSAGEGVKFSFKDISLNAVNKAVKVKGFDASGFVSGSGMIKSRGSFIDMKFSVNSSNITLMGQKISDFHSDIEVYKGIFLIKKTSAKISDTEITDIEGRYELDKGKYSFGGRLINAHILRADIFGKISVNGQTKQDGENSQFYGILSLSDFWINRLKINKYETKYEFTKDYLSLNHNKGTFGGGDLEFRIDFQNKPTIKVLRISDGNMLLNANGVLDRDNFILNVSGNNIDIDLVSDIFDLDIDFTGKANIFLESGGSFKNPKIRFSLDSADGSIMNVPYDFANIDFEVSQNKAVIKTARIYKKNELNLSVIGEFPFWLDDSVKASLEKRSIDVNYSFQDSNLRILDYLSDGFIKAKSGSLSMKGTILGSIKNIENTGRLTVNDATIDLEDYVKRLKGVKIDISWNRNSVKINEFIAKSGSGQINVTGGMDINLFEIEDFDLRIFSTGKGIPLSIPELPISNTVIKDNSKGDPMFDITISGSVEKPKISGKIILENTRFNFSPQAGNGNIPPFFQAADLNIDLISGRSTVYENSFINMLINGKVNISGSYPNIMSNGVIESQSGNLSYLGIDFSIASARVEIINNEVFITGEADTINYNAETGTQEVMRASIERSDIKDLNIRFSSKDDPTLDSKTVYARIIGVPAADSEDTNSVVNRNISDYALRQRGIRLVNSNLTTPFARTILRKTGIIDNLRVSYFNSDIQKRQTSAVPAPISDDAAIDGEAAAQTQPSGAAPIENSSFSSLLYGTKYSFEKNITNQIMIGYSIMFDQKTNTEAGSSASSEVNNEELALRHEIGLRYRVTNNLFLTGTYELGSYEDEPAYQPDRRVMLQHLIRFGGKK